MSTCLKPAIADETICAAVAIIENEACRGLRVPALALRLDVSRRSLERKFQLYLGTTPNNAIRSVQLDEVKRLLAHTSQTLSEIAAATGFQHAEYLNVVFKRREGLTPGRFRAGLQAEREPKKD